LVVVFVPHKEKKRSEKGEKKEVKKRSVFLQPQRKKTKKIQIRKEQLFALHFCSTSHISLFYILFFNLLFKRGLYIYISRVHIK